jgi:hypothetical protein
LISFIVLASNIETGLLLVKPWTDLGSTAVLVFRDFFETGPAVRIR